MSGYKCPYFLKDDTLGRHISADTRPTCRPNVGRHIGQDVSRHSVDTLANMLRLTVDGVSVDCRWYPRIVRRCFAEIAAISLPTGDTKEDSIIYPA